MTDNAIGSLVTQSIVIQIEKTAAIQWKQIKENPEPLTGVVNEKRVLLDFVIIAKRVEE